MTLFLVDLISRCQVIAGQFCQVQPQPLITAIRDLVANLPREMNRADQLVVTEVFDRMLGRWVRTAGLEGQPEIAKGFVVLATTRPTFLDWRNEWLRIADCCVGLCRASQGHGFALVDPRVSRMIRAIETQYADPRLDARTVARAAHVSAWHAARLLRQQTGFSFLAHLHGRRCSVARQLLMETTLSVKEISTAVGYLHPSQLSRHFRSSSGMTPLMFRNAYATVPSRSPN